MRIGLRRRGSVADPETGEVYCRGGIRETCREMFPRMPLRADRGDDPAGDRRTLFLPQGVGAKVTDLEASRFEDAADVVFRMRIAAGGCQSETGGLLLQA